MSDENVHLGAGGPVPVVDFAPYLDGSNKQAVADAMVQSFKYIGFVYLVNHGVPLDNVQGMFDWSKRFFAQSMETKLLAPHPPSGTHHRGYSAPGREKVAHNVFDDEELQNIRNKAPDVKESFEVGHEEDATMPNIWLPDDVLPGFKEACLDFFWTCDKTKFSILGALALGLHLPETFFDEFHQDRDNQLRLLHYPSVRTDSLMNEEITRIGAHSDFGSITLLFQDQVGGLEVEDPLSPGQFKPVTPVKDALIVNAGDFLMRWSNDLIRSTIHRVRAPPSLKAESDMTPERYSIPFFCSPDFTKVVGCLPGTWSDERPKRYEPISAMNYIMERLAANY